MNECKNCYTCIYCYSEPYGYEVWCPMSGRTIDNGFGEGDSSPCKQYIPTKSIFSFTNLTHSEEPLPF